MNTDERNLINQELLRRKTSTHQVILFIMGMVGCLFFATLNIPNKWTHWIIILIEIIAMMALGCNRTGKTFLAGILLTGVSELGLMAVILTTKPFDTTNLPLLDLFVIAICLTVSLLPARWSFYIAAFNTIFIFAVLLWIPHTYALGIFLKTQFYNGFIRPTASQWACLGVLYIWVRGANRHIAKEYALSIEMHILLNKLNQSGTSVVEADASDPQG